MKFVWFSVFLILLGFSDRAIAQNPILIASKKSTHSHKASPTPALEIKVGVLIDVPSTMVASSQNASVLDRSGRPLFTLPANQAVLVQAKDNRLVINNHQSYPGVIFVQPPSGSFIYIGNKWYRGRLLLVAQGSSLTAVNYLDLEQYLYSVVGSEMDPEEHMEALKAQAIAARSYAIVHMIRPANQWFDLGRTERWQAYNGLSKEFNTTQQAVRLTTGQILSYRGGVVESIYADSDYLVATAHQGLGMSQRGAYKLAAQGYNYQQILGRYYPGVSLARLVLRQQ
jgi:peptidoglycan hydrolase-like amidase